MELKEVKQALYSKQEVDYDGGKYIITAYILRFDGKELKHQLELLDIKAKKSVRIVDLKKVKRIKESEGDIAR